MSDVYNKIVEFMRVQAAPVSINQIVAATNLSKGTGYKVLSELARHGKIQKTRQLGQKNKVHYKLICPICKSPLVEPIQNNMYGCNNCKAVYENAIN